MLRMEARYFDKWRCETVKDHRDVSETRISFYFDDSQYHFELKNTASKKELAAILLDVSKFIKHKSESELNEN